MVGTAGLHDHDPGRNILKYGTGRLDRTLMEHDLIDEFHFVVCSVALGGGQRLFEHVHAALHLKLVDATVFSTGVAVLTYTPQRPSGCAPARAPAASVGPSTDVRHGAALLHAPGGLTSA